MVKNLLLLVTASIIMPVMLDANNLPQGPNHLQASPVLTSAERKKPATVVKGSLTSVKNTKFEIQFFNNPVNRGATEGKTFLGQIEVKTNNKGKACFTATLPLVKAGTFISATATRLQGALAHPTDTSEFSKNIKVK